MQFNDSKQLHVTFCQFYIVMSPVFSVVELLRLIPVQTYILKDAIYMQISCLGNLR